jgi:hypothetical protein
LEKSTYRKPLLLWKNVKELKVTFPTQIILIFEQMKNRKLIVALLAFTALFAYKKLSPTVIHYSTESGEMVQALEKQFKCKVASTNYQLKDWHQTFEFKLADDSKSSVSKEEAREFLASNFSTFQFIDEFSLK